MHAEHVMWALDGAKAVLCEKPFAMNLQQSQRVVALVCEKKLFLMKAMRPRFMPALAELRPASLPATSACHGNRMPISASWRRPIRRIG